eukprot:m51a1_g12547 hypothetical protein (409) ;mRNA; r:1329-3139
MKVTRVFRKLDVPAKVALLRLIQVSPAKEDDEDLAEQLDVETEDRGVRTLLENLDKEQIVELYKCTPGAEPEEEDGKKERLTSKSAMLKRLEDRIAEIHAGKWLEALSEAQLDYIADALDLEEDRPKARKDLIQTIVDRVYLEGGLALFGLAGKELLLKVAKAGGLEKLTAEHTKQQILEAFETGEVPKAEKRKAKSDYVVSEKKPEIEKGISLADLHSHYYFGELQTWCKEKGIKSAGNKKEVVKRILAFLNGDESVAKAVKKVSGAAAKKRDAPDDGKKEAAEPAAKKGKKEAAEPRKDEAKKDDKAEAKETKKTKKEEAKEAKEAKEKEAKEAKEAKEEKEEAKEPAKKKTKKEEAKEAKEAKEKEAKEHNAEAAAKGKEAPAASKAEEKKAEKKAADKSADKKK